MLQGIEVTDKVFLEPSAGKGNIIDVLNERNAKQVLSFEKDQTLARSIQHTSTYLGDDFLKCTPEQVSHVDYIVMNPPFSQDEQHILHAWNIAPEGCEIVALCNSETVKNQYSTYRRRLGTIISDYGDATTDLKDCFSTSERKTNVNVSLVRLFKPVTSEQYDYEGFFLEDEPEYTQEGVIKYNEIRTIVSRYIAAIKCFAKMKENASVMNELVSPIGLSDGFQYSLSYNNVVTTQTDFAKELQKKSWQWIFHKMNIEKYVTSSVMKDVNKFVETQSKYPFTMKNIYRMIDIIIGTRSQTMNRSLVDAFDKITGHYHDNRYNLEGWKTNSHYLIGKKFILPNVSKLSFSGGLKFEWGGRNTEHLNDLQKALSFISASNEELVKLEQFKPEDGELEFGTWYDWGFFEIKGFKKGTIHCKFKDDKLWELFNRKVSEIKGFPLPEKL